MSRHTWNHRVMAHRRDAFNGITNYAEIWFVIHEVHYEDDTPTSYTESGVVPYGDTIENLSEIIDWMKVCLDKPILWHGDRFPEVYEEPVKEA